LLFTWRHLSFQSQSEILRDAESQPDVLSVRGGWVARKRRKRRPDNWDHHTGLTLSLKLTHTPVEQATCSHQGRIFDSNQDVQSTSHVHPGSQESKRKLTVITRHFPDTPYALSINGLIHA
jgi:hypothetical protein